MTPFQKLFWFIQMGVTDFCGEKPQNRLKTCMNDEESASLAELDKKILLQKNPLSKTALHPMTGIGVSSPQVMCVLESPSTQEDKTGKYLSGDEGELAKKMLSAIGLDLQKNTYLTYLTPWRPPGNRLLTNVEMNQCKEFLEQRIHLIRPKFLLLLGVPVMRALLSGKMLSQIRLGREKYLDISTFGTFAPSWLMKNPDYRRQAWEDLKKFKKMIDG